MNIKITWYSIGWRHVAHADLHRQIPELAVGPVLKYTMAGSRDCNKALPYHLYWACAVNDALNLEEYI